MKDRGSIDCFFRLHVVCCGVCVVCEIPTTHTKGKRHALHTICTKGDVCIWYSRYATSLGREGQHYDDADDDDDDDDDGGGRYPSSSSLSSSSSSCSSPTPTPSSSSSSSPSSNKVRSIPSSIGGDKEGTVVAPTATAEAALEADGWRRARALRARKREARDQPGEGKG